MKQPVAHKIKLGLGLTLLMLLVVGFGSGWNWLLIYALVMTLGTLVGLVQLTLSTQSLQPSEEAPRSQPSETMLATLVTAAPCPMLVHTNQGEILAVSQTWVGLSGYNQADIPTIADWLEQTGSQTDRSQGKPSATQNIPDGEYSIRTKAGEWRVWEFSSAPLEQPLDQRPLILTLASDITERNQAEDSLRQQIETLMQANRLKDDFLTIVSHELRTPLNSILGWATLLRSRQFEAEKITQALEIIERNARAQAQLINDLLDIASLLRGKIRLHLCPLNLAALLEASVNTMRPTAEAKQIQIYSDIPPDKALVSGDLERLQQVIWNLLSNAIKFTPVGGWVEIILSVVPSDSFPQKPGEKQSGYVQIQIQDTGQGISPEFLPYIFERFRQADSSITRSSGGLGLGLAIVRQLLELHQGSIAADSAGEGQGSTFTIRLPLLEAVPDPVKPGEPTITTPPISFPLKGYMILVVDDEGDNLEVMETILTQQGATILTARSAAGALEHMIHSQPDLLISDIGMPEADGYELIRQVRSLPRERGGQIPAIALTAYVREEDRLRALAAGFQQHMAKPIDATELSAIAAHLLQSTHKQPGTWKPVASPSCPNSRN